MKQLIAATLVAATAFTAPAKAADQMDVIVGVAAGVLLGQVMQQPRYAQQQHYYNPYNQQDRVGYARGYDNPHRACGHTALRGYGYTEVITTNCYGQIIGVQRIPR